MRRKHIDWTVAKQAKEQYEPMIVDFTADPKKVAQHYSDDAVYTDGLTTLFEAVSKMRQLIASHNGSRDVPELFAWYFAIRALVVAIVYGSNSRGIANVPLRVLDARLRREAPAQPGPAGSKRTISVQNKGSALYDELLAAERWTLAELSRLSNSPVGGEPKLSRVLQKKEIAHILKLKGGVRRLNKLSGPNGPYKLNYISEKQHQIALDGLTKEQRAALS